jgi:chemotaxis protein methyltransferase CheR
VTPEEVEDIEVKLLLEGIVARYGYDFREYAYASLNRRVLARVAQEGAETVSRLQERVLRDGAAMRRLLHALTVNTTEMFRDPEMYLAFREKVVPVLRTYPFVRIWHAGCSTGEEVYSLAILLQEEGIYDRCRIYATDLNEDVLAKAKEGKTWTANYLRAGGKAAFSDYYTARYDAAIFSPSLRQNVAFCQHNLVTDGVFNEFNVILCRNVMIYFNQKLQGQVVDLLRRSLANLGILILGSRETLRFSPCEDAFEEIDARLRLFRRTR